MKDEPHYNCSISGCLKEHFFESQGAIMEALGLIAQNGTTDGSHHKQWLLDQVVRALLNHDAEKYERWVAAVEDGEDGPRTYYWDEGVAP